MCILFFVLKTAQFVRCNILAYCELECLNVYVHFYNVVRNIHQMVGNVEYLTFKDLK